MSRRVIKQVWTNGKRMDLPWWKREYRGKAAQHNIQLSIGFSILLTIVGVPTAWSVQRTYAMQNRDSNHELHVADMKNVANVWHQVKKDSEKVATWTRSKLLAKLDSLAEESANTRLAIAQKKKE